MKTFILNKLLPILCGFVIATLIFGLIGYGAFEQGKAHANEILPESYALTAVVVEINYEKDLVTAQDGNDNLWQFYGSEDWQEGDCVTLIVSDCGTAEIYDDVIVSARYSNWVVD